MNYDYGNKRQWRRWVWNRIAERCENRRDALVLFLAGEEAFDVDTALERGFRATNMVAVERDKRTVEQLRKKGVLTIEGDLVEVLKTWPMDRPVGVILADFCCALEESVHCAFADIDTNPSFWRTVVAVNLQHGREQTGKAWRDFVYNARPSDEWSMHRGVQLLGTHLAQVANRLHDAAHSWDWVYEAALNASRPAVQQYKSSSGKALYFDTAVYRVPVGHLVRPFSPFAENLKDKGVHMAQRRRTAAVLAHHTRRSA